MSTQIDDTSPTEVNKLTEVDDYIAWVKWEYEDQLPTLSDKEYSAMFGFSRIFGRVGVRMFPYIEQNGRRTYLG